MGLLYTIATVLIVLWLVAFFIGHVASPLIHLILVVAVVLFVYNLITGRRTV